MRGSLLIRKLLPRLPCCVACDAIQIVKTRRFSAPSEVENAEYPVEFKFMRDSLLEYGKPDNGKHSCDALSIAEVVNRYDFSRIETQKFLRQYREKLNESLVVQVLQLVKNPEKGVRFFVWAGRQIGYSHSFPVYDALLGLIEAGEVGDKNDRVPDAFLREIRDDDKEVLEKLLNVMIRRRCRGGQWNAALEELGKLKDLGYKPSVGTYNALIKVFLKAEKLDSAHLVYREMNGLGFKLNAITLGCFVYSLCKVGKLKEALSLIKDEEFSPDTGIYNKLISGLCEASLFDEALDFLNQMKASSCLPNVLTYHTLLRGCLRENKLGRCKRILSMMIKEGCYPSRRVFDSLVHAFCKSRDYPYAYKLVKKAPKWGYQPRFVLYNILIGGICGDSELPDKDDMELAEKIYSEMLLSGVVLNKINLSRYARCLCEFGKADDAYGVIQEMMNKGFVPDATTYSKVITYICNASRVQEAFLLFQNMKKNGFSADVYTYSILIDSFCKAGLLDQGRKWFDEMEENGCPPTVVTYTSLIHAYLKAGNVSEAEVIFRIMVSKDCIPNVVTYTTLIDGLCKAGKTETACNIYAKMKDGSYEVSNDMGFGLSCRHSIEPNVFTYGAMISGLCKGEKVREAYDVLEAMAAANCRPNQVIYDTLIDGFCKAGQLEEAQEVLSKMLGDGLSPNVFTYGCLIDRMFKEKRIDLALKVLSKMVEDSCALNVVIYTEMIDGLCKIGKTDEACKLLAMMEEKGCKPNVVTYTAVLDGLGRAGDAKKCLEMFRRMLIKGCPPNYITYTVLIKHFSASGLLNEAEKLLEQMKQTYWPSRAGCKKLIEGFNREFLVSHGILSELGEHDGVPVVPAYRILVDSFVKAGRLDAALRMLEELSRVAATSPAEERLHLSLAFSLSLAGRVDKAVELYAKMAANGGAPDVGVVAHLVGELCRVNRWEEALEFSFSVSQMEIKWV